MENDHFLQKLNSKFRNSSLGDRDGGNARIFIFSLLRATLRKVTSIGSYDNNGDEKVDTERAIDIGSIDVRGG